MQWFYLGFFLTVAPQSRLAWTGPVSHEGSIPDVWREVDLQLQLLFPPIGISKLSVALEPAGLPTGVARAHDDPTVPCRGESLSTPFLIQTTLSKGFIGSIVMFLRYDALEMTRIGSMEHDLQLAGNGT